MHLDERPTQPLRGVIPRVLNTISFLWGFAGSVKEAAPKAGKWGARPAARSADSKHQPASASVSGSGQGPSSQLLSPGFWRLNGETQEGT